VLVINKYVFSKKNKLLCYILYYKFAKTLVEKPHFATCFKQLKVLFVIILKTKIVANDIFNHLRQPGKWGFFINETMSLKKII